MALYAAEGSDWNWWYGDEHTSDNQEQFDELFRNYLMKVYKVIGKEVPPNLYVPILLEDRKVAPGTEVRGFISPKIDGWYQAIMNGTTADISMLRRAGAACISPKAVSRTFITGSARTACISALTR